MNKTDMMNIRNHVQLMGRLGADPQVRTMENGTAFARFLLAINESYTNKKGERVNETQWHQVVAWGSLAVVAGKILQKGTQVVVEGKLSNRNWTDKEGVKRTSTEIIANELQVNDK